METFINEGNMRFEALQQLRQIQSNLVGVSFLPVIGIMKENNPYIKNVIAFQDELDNLAMNVQKFISEAKNGIDYGSEEEMEEPKEEEPKEEEPKEEEPEKPVKETIIRDTSVSKI